MKHNDNAKDDDKTIVDFKTRVKIGDQNVNLKTSVTNYISRIQHLEDVRKQVCLMKTFVWSGLTQLIFQVKTNFQNQESKKI